MNFVFGCSQSIKRAPRFIRVGYHHDTASILTKNIEKKISEKKQKVLYANKIKALHKTNQQCKRWRTQSVTTLNN